MKVKLKLKLKVWSHLNNVSPMYKHMQDRWLGDAIADPKRNSKSANFIRAVSHTHTHTPLQFHFQYDATCLQMTAIQDLNKDNSRLYSARVTKLSRSLKASTR